MNLIQRLHQLETSIGISPKVADPFVLGVLGLIGASLVRLVTTGEFVFDLTQLKLLGGAFVLALSGAAAPVVAGTAPNGRKVSVGTKEVIEGHAVEIKRKRRR